MKRRNSVSSTRTDQETTVTRANTGANVDVALGTVGGSLITRVGSFLAAAKLTIFQVVFLLMKEDQLSSQVLLYLSSVVEHLQFFLFFLSPLVIPPTMQRTVTYGLVYQITLAFNVNSVVNTAANQWFVFWVASLSVLLTAGLLIYLVIAVHRESYIFLWPLKVLRLLVSLLSSVLYLPFVRTLLQALVASDASPGTTFVALLCVATLFAVAITSKLVYFDTSITSDVATARSHGRVEAAWVLTRSVLVALFAFAAFLPLDVGSLRITLCLGLLVLSVTMLGLRAFYVPFYWLSTNKLAVGLVSMLVWNSAVCIGAQWAPTMSFGMLALLMLVGSLATGLLAGIGMHKWFSWYFMDALRTPVPQMMWLDGPLAMVVQHTHKQKPQKRLADYANSFAHPQDDATDADLPEDSASALGLSQLELNETGHHRQQQTQHDKNGPAAETLSSQAFAKLDIQAGRPGSHCIYINGCPLKLRSVFHVEVFARILMHDSSWHVTHNVSSFYAAALKLYPRNALVLLAYARFLDSQHNPKAQQEAMGVYEKLEKVASGTFDVGFFCFAALRIRKRVSIAMALQSNEDDARDIGVVAHLELQQNLSRARTFHFRTLRQLHAFWQMLLLDEVNLADLQACMHRIVSAQRSTTQSFASLLQQYPKAPRILRAYARFLSEIRSDVATAQRFVRMAEECEQAQQAQMRTNQGIKGEGYSETRRRTAVSLASTLSGAIRAGRNVGLLGLSEDEIIGMHMRDIVPNCALLESSTGMAAICAMGPQRVMVMDDRGRAMLLDLSAHQLHVSSMFAEMSAAAIQEQLYTVRLAISEIWREPLLFVTRPKDSFADVDHDHDDDDAASEVPGAEATSTHNNADATIVGVSKTLSSMLRLKPAHLMDSPVGEYVSDISGAAETFAAVIASRTRQGSVEVPVRVKSRTGFFTARAQFESLDMQELTLVRFSKMEIVHASTPASRTVSPSVTPQRRSSATLGLASKRTSLTFNTTVNVVEEETVERKRTSSVAVSEASSARSTPGGMGTTEQSVASDADGYLHTPMTAMSSRTNSVSGSLRSSPEHMSAPTLQEEDTRRGDSDDSDQDNGAESESKGHSSASHTTGDSSRASSVKRRIKAMRHSMNDQSSEKNTSGSVQELRRVVYLVLVLLFASVISNYVSQVSFLEESQVKVQHQIELGELPVLVAEAGYEAEFMDVQLRELRIASLAAQLASLNSTASNNTQVQSLTAHLDTLLPPGLDAQSFHTELVYLLARVDASKSRTVLTEIGSSLGRIHGKVFSDEGSLSAADHAQVLAISEPVHLLLESTSQQVTQTMSVRDIGFEFVSSIRSTTQLNLTTLDQTGVDLLESIPASYFVMANSFVTAVRAMSRAANVVQSSFQVASQEASVIGLTTFLVAMGMIWCLMWLTFRPVVNHISMENHFTLETFLDIPRRHAVGMVNRYKRLMLAMDEETQSPGNGGVVDQGDSETDLGADDRSVGFSEGSWRSEDTGEMSSHADGLHGAGDSEMAGSVSDVGESNRQKKRKKRRKDGRSVLGRGETGMAKMHVRYIVAFVVYAVIALASFVTTQTTNEGQHFLHQRIVDVADVQVTVAQIPHYLARLTTSTSWTVYNETRAGLINAEAALSTQWRSMMQAGDAHGRSDAQNKLLFSENLCSTLSCSTEEERKMGAAGVHNLMQRYMRLVQSIRNVPEGTRVTFETAGVVELVKAYRTLVVPALDRTMSLLSTEVRQLMETEHSVSISLLLAGIVVIVLDLLLIFSPMMSVLNSQAQHVEHMFLMIPLETLMELPHVMRLLGLDDSSKLLDDDLSSEAIRGGRKLRLEAQIKAERRQKRSGSDDNSVDVWVEEQLVSGADLLRDEPQEKTAQGSHDTLDPEFSQDTTEPEDLESQQSEYRDVYVGRTDGRVGAVRTGLQIVQELDGLLAEHPKRVAGMVLLVNLLWWVPVMATEGERIIGALQGVQELVPVVTLLLTASLGSMNVLGVMPIMFVVMVLVQGASLEYIRDFHLLLQTVMLPACSLYGYMTGANLDMRVVLHTIVPGAVGAVAGLVWMPSHLHYVMLAAATLGFVCGMIVASWMMMSTGKTSTKSRFDSRTKGEIAVLALLGGALTSSSGSGMGMLVYFYMVLFLQTNQDTAIHTSLSALGVNSVLSLLLHLVAGKTFAPHAVDVITVMAPWLLVLGFAGVHVVTMVSPLALHGIVSFSAMALFVTKIVLNLNRQDLLFVAVTLLLNSGVLSYLLAVGGNIRSSTLLLVDTKAGKEDMVRQQRKTRKRRKQAKIERERKKREARNGVMGAVRKGGWGLEKLGVGQSTSTPSSPSPPQDDRAEMARIFKGIEEEEESEGERVEEVGVSDGSAGEGVGRGE